MILRPAIAANPLAFGKCARPEPELRAPAAAFKAGGDLQLFGTAFAAGFLFVSILIA